MLVEVFRFISNYQNFVQLWHVVKNEFIWTFHILPWKGQKIVFDTWWTLLSYHESLKEMHNKEE